MRWPEPVLVGCGVARYNRLSKIVVNVPGADHDRGSSARLGVGRRGILNCVRSRAGGRRGPGAFPPRDPVWPGTQLGRGGDANLAADGAKIWLLRGRQTLAADAGRVRFVPVCADLRPEGALMKAMSITRLLSHRVAISYAKIAVVAEQVLPVP